MTADGGRLSTDALFQILGNSRRRFIIRHLYRTNDPVDLKELARLIAAEEEGTTPEALTDEERQRVYVSLYQTHLPTLTESGLIEYDESERTLSIDRRALEAHCVEATADRWLVGYAVVALVCALGGVVFSLGGVVGAGGASGFLLVVSLALAGLVIGQYLRRTRTFTRKCLLSLVD
ncbi:hypothetical protein SAMN04487948_101195 [Halogranum amylolyticum]|uniref:DUF7344 domain-containing protein n=1 Tax=Halogranum amylolyticum TaxID=660520 RepID=A0A1H8MYU7_9EURY|nr:hypothetical protein [Halogranum amylolyticum]SEO22561.1 hypothetical protein SAMN04487948_101195 [Halogranum amylolyticum]